MPPPRKPRSSLRSTGNSRVRQRPTFVAIDKGYYAAEGLKVTIDSGPGSVKGITRIAAGTYPIGFMDINSLAKFLDQNPGAPVTAVLNGL